MKRWVGCGALSLLIVCVVVAVAAVGGDQAGKQPKTVSTAQPAATRAKQAASQPGKSFSAPASIPTAIVAAATEARPTASSKPAQRSTEKAGPKAEKPKSTPTAATPTHTPRRATPTLTPVPPTATPTPKPQPPTPIPAPEVIELSGRGQQVTRKLEMPSAINRVSLTHNGESNFIVTAFGPQGEEELLVNEIGAYRGTRAIYSGGKWFLELTADGPWTLRIQAIGLSPRPVTQMSGTGDMVSNLFAPPDTGPVPYEFTHNGESNFAVWLHCADGSDLVQNEIGRVSGSAVADFQGSPCMWDIQADGKWSFRRQE